MRENVLGNKIRMLGFTALLGGFAGIVIWIFLKAVSTVTGLLWNQLPAKAGSPWIMLFVFAALGLILGFLHRKYGNYPDELKVVMGHIRKEKHYDYHPMFVMLLCAFIPLIGGASVGPEAGLTGIIAALCYWIGDNVTYARKHEAEYSKIGEAVAIGQLFHSPLFGIFLVEENESDFDSVKDEPRESSILPRAERVLFYGISTAASFLTIAILNALFGKAMEGFPSFEWFDAGPKDYVMMLVYIPVGIGLCFFFRYAEKLTGFLAGLLPAVVREIVGGLVLFAAFMILPGLLFSGEEQMGLMNEVYGRFAPLALIGFCLLKLFMTALSIRFGWKGGHFFPMIFGCSCMGFGIAMLAFANSEGHVIFAAAIVCASAFGAQLKKPLAAAALLMLCFPVRYVFWMFFAALAAAWIPKLFRGHSKA
ncbi:MAG: chloride channel protein [Eubacterium sp.]|nr:chloride channel protein [Eubacterium sp.]